MANQSAKKQAQSNKAHLTVHRNAFVSVFVLSFFCFWYAGRHIFLQAVLAAPGFISGYLLQKFCTPRYDSTGKLVSPGQDFTSPGVIEYMRDIVYLTWAALLLSAAFGMKAWLLLAVVPVFASYKVFTLLKAGLGLFRGGSSGDGHEKRE